MNDNVNKHGLSRTIPPSVKREVRKRCGFGCVVCGIGIYEYEHILPEFKDAETHDAECITLLCGACHSRVTRGVWSKEKIIKANENPSCIKRGYSRDLFDIEDMQAELWLGSTRISNTERILMYENQVLLALTPPTLKGEPYKLSGIFCNETGDEMFRILENEWIGPVKNWDIEMTGRNLKIRTQHRNIALHIELNPPNSLKIKRLKMSYGGSSLNIKPNGLIEAKSASGVTMRLTDCAAVNCGSGLRLGKNGLAFG